MPDLPIVLVVEDDQLLQCMVEDALTDAGFRVIVESSVESAIKILKGTESTIRALVTDINLGRNKLDGWEIARKAREMDPVFPVVYMSGDSAEVWTSKGVPNSIMLAKPFAPAQLVSAVCQLLNGNSTTA